MSKPNLDKLCGDRRGGSFVEHLILVACVAVLALGGWRTYATTAQATVETHAGCIASMAAGCRDPGSATAPGGATAPGSGAGEIRTGAQRIQAQGETDTKSWGQSALDVARGFFVDGLWGTVTGLWEMVTHPIETVQGLWTAITNPIDTYHAISDAISNAWEENPERVIGAGIFEVITLPVAALKATKAARLARATRVVRTIDRVDDATPDEAARALAIARRTEEAAAARRWADDLASSAQADPAQVAIEAARFAQRRQEIQRAYQAVMNGTAEPPPGVTRERLRLAVEGGPDGQRIPLQFADRAQFDRFQSELRDIFRSEGIDDATVNQVGSATTGFKGNPSKPSPFNPDGSINPSSYWSPSSDLDFAVFSDRALAQARAAGATVNENVIVGGRYTVLRNSSGVSNTSLGQKLDAFARRWNQEFYGDAARQPGFEGIDFKINLSNQPFHTAPTIITP